MNRRQFLLAGSCVSMFFLPESAKAQDEVTEYQAGDPGDSPEALVLTRQQLQLIEVITSQSKRIFKHKNALKLFSGEVLRVAKDEALAGVSRQSNEKRITEYLNLLGLDFYDDNGRPTKYCAAGLSWAVCRAYCDMQPDQIAYNDRNRLSKLRDVTGDIRSYYFLPHAQCKAMADDGKRRDQWVQVSEKPKPGWIVFFNWSGGSHPQHVGLVQGLSANSVKTIEFNTSIDAGPNQGNGGAVAEKTRDLRYVLGYLRTY